MDVNEINKIIWDIDQEDGILDYRLPNGLCIWLLVRYPVYLLLFAKSARGHQIRIAGNAGAAVPKKNSKQLLLSYWAKSLKNNPLGVRKQFDCINVCSSLGCYPTQNGYRSRMSGFLNDFKDVSTLHVIRSNGGAFQERYEGAYCFYDFLVLREHLKQKLLANNRKQLSREFIKILEENLQAYLSTEELDTVYALIHGFFIQAPGIERSFRRFLAATRPQLILIEDANYGTLDTCTLIMVAKELGIKTAEIQHGVFDIGFQYPAALLNSPLFAMHKTDYILTFGEYFSELVRSSSKTISIGSQFLEEQEEEITLLSASHEGLKVLFIAQREFTDRLIPVIYTALKNIEIPFAFTIRLHPSERLNTAKYECFHDFPGTTFSIDDNVYQQIALADVVIGSYSTLLIESLYFDKQPLIHRNDLSDRFVPEGIGIRFSDAEELAELLSGEMPGVEKRQKEYFWKQGCGANFENFYRNEILNTHRDKETLSFNRNPG